MLACKNTGCIRQQSMFGFQCPCTKKWGCVASHAAQDIQRQITQRCAHKIDLANCPITVPVTKLESRHVSGLNIIGEIATWNQIIQCIDPNCIFCCPCINNDTCRLPRIRLIFIPIGCYTLHIVIVVSLTLGFVLRLAKLTLRFPFWLGETLSFLALWETIRATKMIVVRLSTNHAWTSIWTMWGTRLATIWLLALSRRLHTFRTKTLARIRLRREIATWFPDSFYGLTCFLQCSICLSRQCKGFPKLRFLRKVAALIWLNCIINCIVVPRFFVGPISMPVISPVCFFLRIPGLPRARRPIIVVDKLSPKTVRIIMLPIVFVPPDLSGSACLWWPTIVFICKKRPQSMFDL